MCSSRVVEGEEEVTTINFIIPTDRPIAMHIHLTRAETERFTRVDLIMDNLRTEGHPKRRTLILESE